MARIQRTDMHQAPLTDVSASGTIRRIGVKTGRQRMQNIELHQRLNASFGRAIKDGYCPRTKHPIFPSSLRYGMTEIFDKSSLAQLAVRAQTTPIISSRHLGYRAVEFVALAS